MPAFTKLLQQIIRSSRRPLSTAAQASSNTAAPINNSSPENSAPKNNFSTGFDTLNIPMTHGANRTPVPLITPKILPKDDILSKGKSGLKPDEVTSKPAGTAKDR